MPTHDTEQARARPWAHRPLHLHPVGGHQGPGMASPQDKLHQAMELVRLSQNRSNQQEHKHVFTV